MYTYYQLKNLFKLLTKFREFNTINVKSNFVTEIIVTYEKMYTPVLFIPSCKLNNMFYNVLALKNNKIPLILVINHKYFW